MNRLIDYQDVESDKVKICAKCVLDTTVHDIWFDERGKCKYCYIHDEMEQLHPLDGSEDIRLKAIVKKIKDSGKGKKYDCICGLSGGRDSTYTLYTAIKLGLHPLAVNLDNGWGTPIADKNIQNACKILNVDLVSVKIDWEEYKDIQRAFVLAGVSDVDLPSDLGIYALLFSMAKKHKVKYVLNGHSFRTEGTSPISWSYFDPLYIKDVYNKFGSGKKLETLPTMSMMQLFKYTFINGIREVRVLEYMNYEKKKVDDLLSKELNWEYYGGHHHENVFTHFIQSYYLPKKFNIDKRKTELSAMIRSGQTSKDKALQELEEAYEFNDKMVQEVIKKMGFTQEEFQLHMKAPNKTHADFKTMLTFYRVFRGPINLFTRLHVLPRILYLKYSRQ